MKPSISVWDLLGWIAVVGMLALSSPGVKIVHAEGDRRAQLETPAPGPSCQADSETTRSVRRVLSVDISRLVAMQAPAAAEGVVALETGGYGYDEEPASGAGGAPPSSAAVPAN